MRQLGRSAGQRVERGHRAGKNQPAEIGSAGDTVEGERRPRVDDDKGRIVREKHARGAGHDQTVSPHLAGIAVTVLKRHGNIPRNEENRAAHVVFHGRNELVINAGNHGGNHRGLDALQRDSGPVEQEKELHADVVGREAGIRAEGELPHPGAAVEPHLGGGVADIKQKQIFPHDYSHFSSG